MRVLKNKKLILLILLIVIFIFFIMIKNNNKYVASNKHFVENYLKINIEDIKIKNIEDIYNVGLTLSLAIEGYTDWDKLELSDKFKTKFKNKNCIIENHNEYEKFDFGSNTEMLLRGKKNVWIYGDKWDNVINTLKYGEPVSTEFIFEYELDENNLLDDVKLIRKKDVYSLNVTRVDGEKEVTFDNISTYIHKLANPNNQNINEYYSDIPMTKNCEIINIPDIEKLGEPRESSCNINGEDVKLVFDYGSFKKIWNVKYNINIDYKIDYVEFVETL